MERRKPFPIIEIRLSDLEGVLILRNEDVEFAVKGCLSLEGTSSTFSGTVDGFPDFNAEYDLELKDKQGRQIVCNNCVITHIGSEGVKLGIIQVNIAKGYFNKEDKVEVYQVIRVSTFRGSECDEQNNQIVNRLDFLSPEARLYYFPFQDIPDSGGYLYLPMTFDEMEDFSNRVSSKLCWLLSFAFGNLVDAPYQVIWKDSGNYLIRFSSSSYSTEGNSIFCLTRPGVVQSYLAQAWQGWDKYIGKVDLPVLIHYYALIQSQQYAEVQMLLGSVWMEAIKHQYALKLKGYGQNKNGYFLKPESTGTYKFEELIQQVYTHFNVTAGDLSFIHYRNEVVHQGRVNLPPRDIDQQVETLLASIERVMLNALGYRGLIWDRLKKEWLEYFG